MPLRYNPLQCLLRARPLVLPQPATPKDFQQHLARHPRNSIIACAVLSTIAGILVALLLAPRPLPPPAVPGPIPLARGRFNEECELHLSWAAAGFGPEQTVYEMLGIDPPTTGLLMSPPASWTRAVKQGYNEAMKGSESMCLGTLGVKQQQQLKQHQPPSPPSSCRSDGFSQVQSAYHLRVCPTQYLPRVLGRDSAAAGPHSQAHEHLPLLAAPHRMCLRSALLTRALRLLLDTEGRRAYDGVFLPGVRARADAVGVGEAWEDDAVGGVWEAGLRWFCEKRRGV